MTEQPEKKGMSKGCLIGLIVGGVLLLIVVVGMFVCMTYKDDLMKFGVRTMVSGVKVQLAEQEVPVIDTVVFNKVADAFLLKMDESELDPEQLGLFAQKVQPIVSDNAIDSLEAIWLIEAMVEYFPDLKDIAPELSAPAVEDVDSSMVE